MTAKSPKVKIRIFPFSEPAPLATLHHFVVLDLGDEENAIVYREGQLSDYIEQSPVTIEIYRRRFEKLWEKAMGDDESKLFIADMAALIRAPRGKRRV
jgi:hypothetical protein